LKNFTLYDVFISYGRKDSKDFAINLRDRLTQENFKVWLDFNDMPPAVEFQKEINQAIEKSHNCIFIIAPHAVNSAFCCKEIELAVELNKCIIPIMYLSPQDCWDKMHPAVKKRDHIFFRKDKLESGEIDFEEKFADLVSALRRDAEAIEQHTRLLMAALYWKKNRSTENLLIANERKQAELWLQERAKEKKPPCVPTDLQCEYICESSKNAHNLMTRVFISYAIEDQELMLQLSRILMRHHFTLRLDKSGYHTKIEFIYKEVNGFIEEADHFIFLLSPNSAQSYICDRQLKHAKGLNKHIIGLVIADTDLSQYPSGLKNLQLIDFTGYPEQHACLYRLFYELRQHAHYYEQHKVFLMKALRWHRNKFKTALLLRGTNLDYLGGWFDAAQKRPINPPVQEHAEFIMRSRKQPPNATLDVFIAYSRSDSDFARRLNDYLQFNGDKTTWFDQESIPAAADFEQEMLNGITKSHYFLFIISPQSVNSPFCKKEIEHAQALNKRIVTLLYRALSDDDKLHDALKKCQWIDFTQLDKFEGKAIELIGVFNTDRDHIEQKTKWLLRACEWLKKEKDESLLLQGSELDRAKAWLKEAKAKEPDANHYLEELIEASKKAIIIEERKERKLEEKIKDLQIQNRQLLKDKYKLKVQKDSLRFKNIWLLGVSGMVAWLMVLSLYLYCF
jgi:hypothetical protein